MQVSSARTWSTSDSPRLKVHRSDSSSTSRWCAFSTRTRSLGRRALRSEWFAPLGRWLGDPRLGMAAFLSLRRVLPNRYPLELDVERYIAAEQRLGRMLDYAVIVPRLQLVQEASLLRLSDRVGYL